MDREFNISPMKIGLGVGALAVCVVGLFGSWYTVPEGYRGVITRNGGVVGEAAPGLGFKMPLIDKVQDMSVQTVRWNWQQPFAAYSRDIQQANVTVSVSTRLLPDNVRSVYSTVGVNYGDTLLTGLIPQALKEVFGQYQAADIISKREQVAAAVMDKIGGALKSRGIIVEAVQIENIDFSDTYEKAAEEAATAQANVRRAQQELEKVKVDSQRQVAEAEAQASATRTRADADAYATKAAGEAEAAAIQAKGSALRDNPALVSLITAQKWNGTLPTTMVPGSAVPFVSLTRQP